MVLTTVIASQNGQKEYERVTNAVGCTVTEKFLFARPMMSGSANLFTGATNDHKWETFKRESCNKLKQKY